MKQKPITRILSLLLVAAMLAGLLSLSASAESLITSSTVTIQSTSRNEFLSKSTGGTLGGSSWQYTSNDGITGTAYCVNWGLGAVSPSKALTIQEYNRNPPTMGAFANGFPNRTLEQFKDLHQSDVRGIDNLTEEEYKYATQIAVWATCGQLAVAGTAFTAGRASLVEPTADAQQIRVYDSVRAILLQAQGWSKNLYSGIFLRADEDRDIRGVEVVNESGLEGAAADNVDGIKKETISGKEYYTRVLYVSSATSTWIDGYTTKVYSNDAPSGTIFVSENNSPLETVQEDGSTRYKVDTSAWRDTNLNANGEEYYGAFKVCIPVDNVTGEGSFTVEAYGGVAQYNLFLAYNPSASEQSYIISDPGYSTGWSQIPIKWSSTDIPEKASLQVVKAGAGGSPLEGASFTLTGSGGTTVTGTTGRNGQIIWTDLPADETYTLMETAAPEGYRLTDPVNVTLTAGRTAYVTVSDDTENTFKVKKVDAQNKASLQGAEFVFEQIDGSYKTTGTTGFDGTVSFRGNKLPYGSYRVYEQSAPQGYQKDTRVETIRWDGSRDVTLTFENVRDIGLTIVKKDADTGVSLPNATFDVYADGEFLTSVTTNDAGEAYVTGIKKEAYIEIVETTAPAGYVLDRTSHGIHIDPYDPAIDDDPVITVTNQAKPALRIIKYDQQSGKRLSGVTFEIYKDGALFDTKTTNENGEITLYDLEPGVYLVKEISTDDSHVVNSTPQEIKLEAGQTATQELVFFNSLKPGIHLIKVDSVTMKSLPNVRFEFKKVGGSYRQEFTTDINGEIDLSKLEPGAYEVRELEAPEGYLIDDAVRVVQINPDETANFVFTNTPKPSLRLIKTSSNGTRLGGVHFRIAKIEDGTRYLDRITDDKGEINVYDLDPGVYSVQETATVADHILDPQEYHVELFPGQTSTLVLENKAKPDLKIVKTDAITGDPVKGVTFTLRGADGPTFTTEATDAKGEVLIENLDPGVYEIWEQSVPDGYLLDPIPQKITLVPNKTGVVQFQNYPKPTLTIKKIDSATGKPVEGARFHVIYASNHTFTGEINDLGEHYTDADGIIKLDKLRDGWYQVTEVAAPDGYRIQGSGVQECYLAAGTDKVLTFENVPLSTILIQKMDEETGKPLSGAWFRIRYLNAMTSMDGTTLGEYVTDEKGQIELKNLDEGTYVIEEISAPAGYVLSSETTRTVYLAGENQDFISIIYGNQKMGSLLIVKKDSLTGAPLSGVEFFVTDSDGSVVGNGNGRFITDFAGSVLISNLEPGKTIVAKETRTVSGYVLDDAPQTVKIKANETVTLEFRNAPKGTLIVQKIDSATGKPLTGAEFKITAANGELAADNEGLTSSNGIYRTDSNGQVVLEKLTPGAYVVTETRAPDGYELTAQPQTVVVNAGDTQTITIENPPKGTLIVQKYDKVSGQPLPGAEFKIMTASGEFVADNEGLTSSNGVYVTDQNGQIILSKLNSATYVVTETKAPEGYQIDPTPQTVVVNANDTQTLNFYDEPLATLTIIKRDVDTKELLSGAAFAVKDGAGKPVGAEKQYVTGSDGTVTVTGLTPNSTVVVSEETPPAGYWNGSDLQTVVLQSGAANSVTFENRKLGTLIIRKFIEGTNNEPLKGVAFRVTASDGTEVGPDGGVYYTNAAGEIVLNDLQPDITVKAREIKTVDGYILDGTPQDVKIIGGQTQMLTFWNAREQTLTIQKYIEGTTTPIEGVVFLITDSSGAVLGTNNGEFSTDRNGRIVLTGLTPGTTVTAKEIKAVSGFILDSNPQSILIKEGEAQTMTFYNERKGSLIVEKRDSITNEPLPGAEFRITTLDGAYVDDNEGQTSTKGIYRTDSYGQIVLSNLQPDSYVIREVKAPEGYVLVTEEQSVKVNANDTQTITFLNEPLCSLTITKLDSVTGKPVPGTVFKVTDGNGNLIGNYTTGADGTVTVTGLIPGSTVVVSEIKVPDGYVLNTTPQTIIVKNGANTATSGGTVSGTGDGSNGNGLTFEDDPTMNLTIHKYIEGTANEPLAGVAFKIVDGSGAPVGPGDGVFYTDAAGEIVVEGLEPGTTVTAQEIKTVEGFVLDGTPKSVEISAGAQAPELVFWNKRAGSLTVRKLDSVTKKPLAGVTFKITYADGRFVDNEGGKISSNGLYYTNQNGEVIISGVTGTLVVTEEQTIEGYTIDEGTRTQTVTVNPDDGQILTFYNTPIGGVELIKVNAAKTSERIPGTTFEIRRIDDALVDTVTTDKNGRVFVALDEGSYYAVEITAAEGFKLDATPTYFEVKAGKTTTKTITNEKFSGITIHKIDSVTGQGIYGVTFVLYDSGKTPIEQMTTDQYGYARTSSELKAGQYFLRELEAAEGYVADTQYKTVFVEAGKSTTIEWENTPITAQIQITKYAAENNTVTGQAKGTTLQGAVYEIVRERSGAVVATIVTDARGVAASPALPLGRYLVREVTAPAYWQLSEQTFDVTLEYPGQIIKLADYDKPAELGVTITKRGVAQALAASTVKYDITVANTSNVPLESFFWHDRIPTDVATATTLTTGTYSARLNYRILYKTNYNQTWQVLASNLLTTNNYSFALNAIPMQYGEKVTDVYFEFGKVPVGFQSVTGATLSVIIAGDAANGYQMINRADVGGKYQETWQTANAGWVTGIMNLNPKPTLPKTGY